MVKAHSSVIAALAAASLMSALAASAAAGSSLTRPANRSERVAIMRSFVASDGNPSGVAAVYLSRSNPSLAVVCQRTPEAGVQTYVFGRSHGTWHYLASGSPGHAGTPADRRLEHACP